MTSTTPRSHDGLFKGLLGKPEHARGVLRSLVPTAMADAIDWQFLTPVSMAFRLLRYQVRIWEEWLARNPDAKTLPMIIPVVMYHGQAPWSDPRLFGDVLAVPPAVRPAVAPYLVQFRYLLHDLSEISDDELRARAMSAAAKLVSLCFKHARTSPDFLAILGRWMDVVREVAQAPNGLSALAQVLCYILQVSEHVERTELHALLARELGPKPRMPS